MDIDQVLGVSYSVMFWVCVGSVLLYFVDVLNKFIC